jgi:hypothetical protein
MDFFFWPTICVRMNRRDGDRIDLTGAISVEKLIILLKSRW